MTRKRHTEEQIIAVLKDAQAGDCSVRMSAECLRSASRLFPHRVAWDSALEFAIPGAVVQLVHCWLLC